MKTLFQIILRYAVSAVGVLLLLLTLNAGVFLAVLANHMESDVLEYKISDLVGAMVKTESGWEMPTEDLTELRDNYVWAMLLDGEGQILWSDRLPENLDHPYTLGQVASFSRWYLEDYPVYVYQQGDGLFVLGSAKDSRWKYPMELGMSTMNTLLGLLPVWICCNLILAVLLILLSSVRFFRSIRRIAGGLSDLAEKRPVSLPEKGVFGSLCSDLNRTSACLMEQQSQLNERDRLRTEWIAGVSHDVRTPLTIILGQAAQIESDPQNPPALVKKAQAIRQQGQRLRHLIDDLNLASKLTYGAQPVHREPLVFSACLREMITSLFNQCPELPLSISVDPSCEGVQVLGDANLLERVVQNLLSNSMTHTPAGTEISVSLTRCEASLALTVQDTGGGYPDSVLEALGCPPSPELPTHGLGLLNVRQIVSLHNGTALFSNTALGAKCTITLPIMSEEKTLTAPCHWQRAR